MEIKGNCNITVKILIAHNLLIIYCKLSESSEPWEFKSQPTKTRLREPENWDRFVYRAVFDTVQCWSWGIGSRSCTTLSTDWKGSLHEKLRGKDHCCWSERAIQQGPLMKAIKSANHFGNQVWCLFWNNCNFPFTQEMCSGAHMTGSNNKEKQRHRFSGEALRVMKGVPGGIFSHLIPR